MMERSIDIDNAKNAIAEPDKRIADSYGKVRVQKKIGDRTVVVVYSEERFKDRKNEYLVITFYYLDK
jgi:hypothetical protein